MNYNTIVSKTAQILRTYGLKSRFQRLPRHTTKKCRARCWRHGTRIWEGKKKKEERKKNVFRWFEYIFSKNCRARCWRREEEKNKEHWKKNTFSNVWYVHPKNVVLVAGDTILGSVGKKEERKKKCYKHTENIFEITQCVIHMSKNIVT